MSEVNSARQQTMKLTVNSDNVSGANFVWGALCAFVNANSKDFVRCTTTNIISSVHFEYEATCATSIKDLVVRFQLFMADYYENNYTHDMGTYQYNIKTSEDGDAVTGFVFEISAQTAGLARLLLRTVTDYLNDSKDITIADTSIVINGYKEFTYRVKVSRYTEDFSADLLKTLTSVTEAYSDPNMAHPTFLFVAKTENDAETV
jgi:hypothetical protein